MRTSISTALAAAACLLVGLLAADWAAGNGGPFVVKYPSGDPAAKGVLARLDPTLKPARETRLRVVKEDLSVEFSLQRGYGNTTSPLAEVTAAYTIENPTDEPVEVDFGFPILRGIYLIRGMVDIPDARVTVDKESVRPSVISNSVIYGMIRQHARDTIEAAIAGNAELARLVSDVREARGSAPVLQPQPAAQTQSQRAAPPVLNGPAGQPREGGAPRQPTAAYGRAREALRSHLAKQKWNERDAALMVEYASLDFGPMRSYPRDRWDSDSWTLRSDALARELPKSNLGPLTAIGEQKATQFFAQLAAQFDKQTAATYEAIFQAWGGDVRERSVDLGTGEVRAREMTSTLPDPRVGADDRTVYARVEYLDPDAKLSGAEKASCENVLRNLPVVFTFAPMNLLHYEVKFPARTTRVVTVTYRQYAYIDTKGTPSYQLAYVLHPATLWDQFGPINLSVRVPKGLACKASVPLNRAGEIAPGKGPNTASPGTPAAPRMELYTTTLGERKDKSGELFIGLDKAGWDEQAAAALKKAAEEAKKAAEAARKTAPQGEAIFSADLDTPFPPAVPNGVSPPAPAPPRAPGQEQKK